MTEARGAQETLPSEAGAGAGAVRHLLQGFHGVPLPLQLLPQRGRLPPAAGIGLLQTPDLLVLD